MLLKKFKKFFILSLLISIFFLPIENFSENFLNAKRISSTFTKISKKATDAVVFIKAEYNLEKSSNNEKFPENNENPFDFFSDEFFKHFFGHPRNRKFHPMPKISKGSGFIVSKDGYILTNYHVIKNANKITVIRNNAEEYEATIIGFDPRTDLAVLKIKAPNLPYLTFGNSDTLEVGEWVIAIGNPFELQSSVTVGVVSAKGRKNLRITDLEDFIQTDAAINPGNSGGPLLNLDCQVVGINTALISKNGGYMGIGFAIPSNMAKQVYTQIKNTGSVERGYIGIFLQEMDKNLKEAFNLKTSTGVLITEISKDSPAEKAGLIQGDLILEYNNIPVKNLNSFRNEISLLKPNTKVIFKILRNGEIKNIQVILGKYPDAGISKKSSKVEAQESSKIGIEVSEIKDLPETSLRRWNLSKNQENIVITSIKRGSIAEKAGLQPGMVLLQLNKKNINTIKDFQQALKTVQNKKPVLFLVRYKNITRFISIKID